MPGASGSRSITIQDVAVAAGVSLATVSRALADSPRVKPETRRRIQALAKEMGYTPSAIARGLATKRTWTLGVAVRDIADAYIAELVRCIDRQALQRGYTLLLSHSGDDPKREPAAINILRQQRVDGIIVADPSVDDALLTAVGEDGTPAIVIDRPQSPYSVGTDNLAAAQMAVEHLLDLGHTRIAYIGDTRNWQESEERWAGYERGLAQRGLSPSPPLTSGRGGGWTAMGRACGEYLLQLPEPPTAVFCYNDLTAIGAIGALYAAGLRVPEDMSVVGYDDISLARHFEPPLTTIAQDKERLAELAVEMLLELINGQEPARKRLLLPGQLVVRASTGPPPRSTGMP